jgi:hypothetical protein
MRFAMNWPTPPYSRPDQAIKDLCFFGIPDFPAYTSLESLSPSIERTRRSATTSEYYRVRFNEEKKCVEGSVRSYRV